MFTGLITAIGKIIALKTVGEGRRMHIQTPPHWLSNGAVGDSIAIDGACLTVTEIVEDIFEVAVSPETIARCAPWRKESSVNLEHALKVGDKLGGHFVSGHVDGIAHVQAMEATTDGGCRMQLSAPPPFLRLIARKGSVAVAGVSLTVNRVDEAGFEAHIIPHTLSATTLGQSVSGTAVNLETDLIARHIARLIGH